MEIKNLPTKSLVRAFIVLLITIIIGAALMYTQIGTILKAGIKPVVLAFSIAYILNYVVSFLQQKFKMDLRLAILITYLVFILIVVALVWTIIPRFINTLQSLITALDGFDINSIDIAGINIDNPIIQEARTYVDQSLSSIIDQLGNLTGAALSFVLSQVSTITSGIISFVVALIISIYMLLEKKDLRARILRVLYAFTPKSTADYTVYVTKKADMIFRNFVVGKFIDSFIIGLICYAILTVFSFKYALLISVIVGITNMIPYFGPILGMVPATIITLINAPTEPHLAAWMLFIIFCLQQLDGFVIGPWILGDTVGVNAFWIIIAVTVGGTTFGILGMFLGVPTLVLIKTLLEESVHRRLEDKNIEDFYKEDLAKPKKRSIKNLRKKKA